MCLLADLSNANNFSSNDITFCINTTLQRSEINDNILINFGNLDSYISNKKKKFK